LLSFVDDTESLHVVQYELDDSPSGPRGQFLLAANFDSSLLNLGGNGHSIEIEGPDIQMKLSLMVPLLLAVSLTGWAQQAMPRMISVDPMNGKGGDVIAVTGENLQKDAVAKVYLTDGKNDTLVEVTEQTATTIKFKIPGKVPAGARLTLMVLTTGKDAKYIEQPVKLQIDEQ
jgi:IPT/TIG domain